MKSLNLKKQSITELSSKEMEDVGAGRGGWSNFRTGNCKYSQTEGNAITECIWVGDNSQGWSQESVTVGCVKS